MVELGNWKHLCIDMQRLFAEDTPWARPVDGQRAAKVVSMPPSLVRRWKHSLSRVVRQMSVSLPQCLGQSILSIVLSCYPTECAVGGRYTRRIAKTARRQIFGTARPPND